MSTNEKEVIKRYMREHGGVIRSVVTRDSKASRTRMVGTGATARAYLEPEEIEALEKAATNLRDRLLVRLLFHLGCRISKALALTPEDVDLDRGTVRILHLKSRLRVFCPQCNARLGKTHTFCPGCGQRVEGAVKKELEHRRMRTLPLDRYMVEMLWDYLQRGGPVERKGRVELFGINRHRAWQIITQLAQKAGLPRLVHPESGREHGVSPHRLRDAFAVMAVKQDDSGDGLRMLQEHLGHVSFNTTARYRKVAGEEHRDRYNKLWHNKKLIMVKSLRSTSSQEFLLIQAIKLSKTVEEGYLFLSVCHSRW